jgi:hypothetical protein
VDKADYDKLLQRAIAETGFIDHVHCRHATERMAIELLTSYIEEKFGLTYFLEIPYTFSDRTYGVNFATRFEKYINRPARLQGRWMYTPIQKSPFSRTEAHLFSFENEEDMVLFKMVW